MYELDGAPTLYDPDDERSYDHTAELRPDSLYGVSKVYGEALGRMYMERYGLRVFCLRIDLRLRVLCRGAIERTRSSSAASLITNGCRRHVVAGIPRVAPGARSR